MKRRTLGVVTALTCGLLAAAGACFPDYGIGGGDGGGAGESGSGGGSGSGSGSDSGSGGSSGSSSSSGSGSGSGSGSSSSSGSGSSSGGIPPVEAGALANMVLIDGGTFGFPVTEMTNGVQDATATITYTIAIDRDEVTTGRFAGWVDAGMPLPDAGDSLDPGGPYQDVMRWDDSWHAQATEPGYLGGSNCAGAGGNPSPQATYSSLATQPGYPLNCVSWAQALAFCWWDHQKRLPTETEWHVAATSGGQPVQYPWGNTDPPSGDAGCLYSVSQCNGTQCLFPVAAGSATAGATPLGILDLVGSVSEWNWDVVANGTYAYPTTPTVNYYGPDSGPDAGSRMFIESSWYNCAPTVDPAVYGGGGNLDPYEDCGFRCAKTLP